MNMYSANERDFPSMLAVIGINRCNAQGLKNQENIGKAIAEYTKKHCVNIPHILLQTCNRTELYYSGENPHALYRSLLLFFSAIIEDFRQETLYYYEEIHCFIHLFQVVSGIDSPFFGETEIQGQIKRAYTDSSLSMSLSSELHFLFQKALQVGKSVRKTVLPHHLISKFQLEQIIIDTIKNAQALGKRVFPALFIGASAIHQRICGAILSHFLDAQIVVANRTEEKAVEFAKKHGIEHLSFSQALSSWQDFYTVSGAITSLDGTYCLTSQHMYKKSPVTSSLLFDIGVPRNIDPALYPFFSEVYTIETLLPEKITDMNPMKIESKAKAQALALQYYNRFKTQRFPDSVEMI